MSRESGAKAVLKRAIGYVVLVFFALVFIMPFVLSAVTAFKTLPTSRPTRSAWWPTPPTGVGPRKESRH